ncbi:hypothetical protein HD554DRAFT_1157572 [Boletus coccyginus]|nr:hypothetical protein HD554DRAFT_1157572 [Boletus coccyginus]
MNGPVFFIYLRVPFCLVLYLALLPSSVRVSISTWIAYMFIIPFRVAIIRGSVTHLNNASCHLMWIKLVWCTTNCVSLKLQVELVIGSPEVPNGSRDLPAWCKLRSAFDGQQGEYGNHTHASDTSLKRQVRSDSRWKDSGWQNK